MPRYYIDEAGNKYQVDPVTGDKTLVREAIPEPGEEGQASDPQNTASETQED